MGVIKDINVDGKIVRFKASAAIPRLYRMKFSRDIYKDLLILDKINKNKGNIDIESLEIFENIAYIMAYHADDKISNDVGEWLEQFDTLSVYKLLPDLIKLWGINVKTMSTSKKKAKETERTLNTALFLLRAVELGLSMNDLSELTIGLVNDMYIEKNNDSYDYKLIATQEDMDNF